MKANCWMDSLSRKLYFAHALSYSILQLFNCHCPWQQVPQNIQDEDFLMLLIHLTLKILLPTEIFRKEQQIMDWQFANITHSTCGVSRNTLSSRHKIVEAIFIESLSNAKQGLTNVQMPERDFVPSCRPPNRGWLTGCRPASLPTFCFWGFLFSVSEVLPVLQHILPTKPMKQAHNTIFRMKSFT